MEQRTFFEREMSQPARGKAETADNRRVCGAEASAW